jgi:hypothetical protein
MTDFVLPILGLGDEQASPMTITWRDGNIICRGYRGILGGFEPEPELPDNVISFTEHLEKKRWRLACRLNVDDPRPGAA